jgi:hypothetical protein
MPPMAQPKRKEMPTPTLAPPLAESAEWQKPAGIGKRGWAVLGLVVVAINLPLIHYLLRGDPGVSVTLPYQDTFENPATLKQNYFTTGGFWRLQGGALFSPGVRNNPLWLKAKLPQNVRVEFDVRSMSSEGDIRAIIFGDGVNFQLSGYHLIQGGWNNTLSVLARLDENAPSMARYQAWAGDLARRRGTSNVNWVEAGLFGPDTKVRVESNNRVVPGQTYHWLIERRASVIRWSIDGEPFLELDDPWPLIGKGHDRFGFDSVESDLYFDNLRIEALDDKLTSFPARPAITPSMPKAGPFSDAFDRAELGRNWVATDPGVVRLEQGAVVVEKARNHPVWLAQPIPRDASIEFDSWSDSPDGDIKVEAWGDGRSFHAGDPNSSYASSGYVFVLGGWRNTVSAIAKQHEHAADRVARADVRVQPGQHYHWQIRRTGGEISWLIDGKEFLRLSDSAPLEGSGHQYFGFSGWESRVHFANLQIKPL